MLGKCSLCKGGFQNHFYNVFAMAVFAAEKKLALEEFFGALKNHDWSDAAQFQEFDPMLDAAIAYALRCSDGRLGLFVIKDTFELYEPEVPLSYEELPAASSQALETHLKPEGWKPLD